MVQGLGGPHYLSRINSPSSRRLYGERIASRFLSVASFCKAYTLAIALRIGSASGHLASVTVCGTSFSDSTPRLSQSDRDRIRIPIQFTAPAVKKRAFFELPFLLVELEFLLAQPAL